MRSLLLLALCAAIASCVQTDPPNLPVRLEAPYSTLPDASPGTPIEAGAPVKLDPRQQELVVTSVLKWMKDPNSASFGAMAAARNRHGWITVCGTVSGRNSAGQYSGMVPFIGAMAGPSATTFVVVQIGSSAQQRADVATLCEESGASVL
ncbi:hypothetical protein SAMN02745126_04096 [Enhydrobacter aerosaccus]|uniref:Lipoprotein n=1 Tax=Enhydrobacter aerosaccus TaxID=225324 RepID=A0A1T4RW46_9HYPH|nr:hypothetical protein [Enhydrobacter aerosaccus]SKA20107.1 hypothetical protein SAMN02745126_04096 [Enhydrobacter aerosaccus]